MQLEDRYELLEKIGSGSFATVYRAKDNELGREVAVKQIHDQYTDDPARLEEYWGESQLLASLAHPNIVTIFDIYRERGWLILELMQSNLSERMAGRPMPLASVRTTIAHCLRALQYLHERGVIHGDVKPANMMIDARRRIKIGDFGLARRVSDDEGSLLKGATKYMAPEVVSDEFGNIGPASDLYSLGFCAYELMCGSNFDSLFPGLSAFGRNKQAAWMMWHAAPDRRLPPVEKVLEGVPDDVARVVDKLVEKDQSLRYQSAEDALSDLQVDSRTIRGGGGVGGNGSGDDDDATEGSAEEAARKKRLMFAAGAFGLSLLLCIAIMFMPSGGVDGPKAHAAGVVREVLPEKGLIVVESLETGIPVEFGVGKGAKIFLVNEDRNILLRELKPGDRVEFDVPPDDKPLMDIEAARPVRNAGRIKSIDAAEDLVVVAVTGGDRPEDLRLRTPDRARLTLNGEKAALRELKAGDVVDVAHLSELRGKKGRVVDELSARRIIESDGFVFAFDSEKRLLTVSFGLNDNAGRITRPVADDAKIVLKSDGSDSLLAAADLERDDRVKISYDTHFRNIVVTRDEMQMKKVVVQEVNLDDRKIVVSDRDGKRITFNVGPSAEVMLSLKKVPLERLRRYDEVDVTYDGSNAESLQANAVFAVRPSKPDRWVIVIANQKYSPFLTPIPYAVADANLVRDSLLNHYAVSQNRLLMLVDQDRDAIEQKIDALLKNVRKQTQLIVYVSAHAYVDDGGAYIACLDFNWDETAATGLPLAWLVERMEASASGDKILLLDTSHAASAGGEHKDLATQPSTEEQVETVRGMLKTVAAVASASSGQRGRLPGGGQFGLFALTLAEALDGPADADRDLHLTPEELITYLKKHMAEADLPGDEKQTPVLIAP